LNDARPARCIQYHCLFEPYIASIVLHECFNRIKCALLLLSHISRQALCRLCIYSMYQGRDVSFPGENLFGTSFCRKFLRPKPSILFVFRYSVQPHALTTASNFYKVIASELSQGWLPIRISDRALDIYGKPFVCVSSAKVRLIKTHVDQRRCITPQRLSDLCLASFD
jgi:hypothetical protein